MSSRTRPCRRRRASSLLDPITDRASLDRPEPLARGPVRARRAARIEPRDQPRQPRDRAWIVPRDEIIHEGQRRPHPDRQRLAPDGRGPWVEPYQAAADHAQAPDLAGEELGVAP